MRWREEQLEEAIEQDLSRLRIPDDERRDWFRRHLVDVCDSETRMREQRIRQARKRLTELEQMQERLLDGFVGGAIDQNTFNSRRAAMQVEAERLTASLEEDTAQHDDEGVGAHVVALFDFAQEAAKQWRVSNKSDRRAILARLLLKRTLSDVSLDTEKRKPFDFLVERPFLKKSRDGLHGIETVARWFIQSALPARLVAPET